LYDRLQGGGCTHRLWQPEELEALPCGCCVGGHLQEFTLEVSGQVAVGPGASSDTAAAGPTCCSGGLKVWRGAVPWWVGAALAAGAARARNAAADERQDVAAPRAPRVAAPSPAARPHPSCPYWLCCSSLALCRRRRLCTFNRDMSRRTCLRALSAVANAARTITATRVAPRMMRPALAGAPRMLTQHSPTRGFTASGVRGDETSKELAAVVAEELKMDGDGEL
jgi:hypothetical protein